YLILEQEQLNGSVTHLKCRRLPERPNRETARWSISPQKAGKRIDRRLWRERWYSPMEMQQQVQTSQHQPTQSQAQVQQTQQLQQQQMQQQVQQVQQQPMLLVNAGGQQQMQVIAAGKPFGQNQIASHVIGKPMLSNQQAKTRRCRPGNQCAELDGAVRMRRLAADDAPPPHIANSGVAQPMEVVPGIMPMAPVATPIASMTTGPITSAIPMVQTPSLQLAPSMPQPPQMAPITSVAPAAIPAPPTIVPCSDPPSTSASNPVPALAPMTSTAPVTMTTVTTSIPTAKLTTAPVNPVPAQQPDPPKPLQGPPKAMDNMESTSDSALSGPESLEESDASGENSVANAISRLDEDLKDLPTPNPLKWTVNDVCEYIKKLPGCDDYVEDFLIQEIDGQALLLLKADHLMSAMSMKLGPALKICAKIDTLRSIAEGVLGEQAPPAPSDESSEK
ncbi:unnamed protein product, partial [Nesidiocoris tenuis]